jgi:hypothetical protein
MTYTLIKKDIYEVLDSITGFKVYPDNYTGSKTGTSYITTLILPGNGYWNAYGAKKTMSGMLVISIYVQAGKGDAEIATIADTLDTKFQAKTLTNGTQFGASNLKMVGLDPKNPAIYRADYGINFKYYGD